MTYDMELVEFCRDLIRQPSTSGNEEKVARVIESRMKDLGYDEIRFDEMGNVVGLLRGRRPGKTVVLDGHIDTVDISDRKLWKHNPYAAEIEDGRIYGRGASDMKGADSAMIIAAARFAKKCSHDFAGKIYVSCTCNEELFEGVSARAVSRDCRPDYVIIGESTHLMLNRGQRGRAEIVLETHGRTCHSANPEKGLNALRHMNILLEKVLEIQPKDHPLLGKAILEPTDIISSPWPGSSVIPGTCTVTLDRRLMPDETPQGILEPINRAIAETKRIVPELDARTCIRQGRNECWTGNEIVAKRFFPGWEIPEDHELVQKAMKGLKEAGIETGISHYSFCTNASHFCGEAGIPSIGFGPSHETIAHTIDEYIEIDQLQKAETGYEGILRELMA